MDIFFKYSVHIINPIPANTTIQCGFRIIRSETGTQDVKFSFGQPCGGSVCLCDSMNVGYLPDFSVRIEPESVVQYGDMSTMLRVYFDNPAPVPVLGGLASCLSSMPVMYNLVPPDTEDACSVWVVGDYICFMSGTGATMWSVDAESTKSCLIEVQYEQPISQNLVFFMDLTQATPEPFTFIDPEQSNNYVSLHAVQSLNAIPFSRLTFVLIVVLLMFGSYLNLKP